MPGAPRHAADGRTHARPAQRQHSQAGDTNQRRQAQQTEQSSERNDGQNASFAASEPRELGASTAVIATCLSASRDYCDRRTDAADVWRYGVGARPRFARESAGVVRRASVLACSCTSETLVLRGTAPVL